LKINNAYLFCIAMVLKKIIACIERKNYYFVQYRIIFESVQANWCFSSTY